MISSSLCVKMHFFYILLLIIITITIGQSIRIGLYCKTLRLENGRIRYRQHGRIIRYNCNYGYTLIGDKYNTCINGTWDSPISKCVRATCKRVDKLLNGIIYPAYNGAVLNFYCKSNYILYGSNINYCDGKLWTNPPPSCLPSNQTPTTYCNFDHEDLCGWRPDFNHDFDWKRLNYQTPSAIVHTGPTHDHTKGFGKDGYYMYTESTARNINDTARLISPTYKGSINHKSICFEFWYHMWGSTIGELRIYLIKSSDPWKFDPTKAIFRLQGDHGNKWYRGKIDFGPILEDYHVVIEGVRGVGYLSDIAIDDVRIMDDCNDDAIDGTTDSIMTGSDLPTVQVESCENRCNEMNRNLTRNNSIILCDCDDNCVENNRCCLDYMDFCVVDSTVNTDTTDITRKLVTIGRVGSTGQMTVTPKSVVTTGSTRMVSRVTNKMTKSIKRSTVIFITPPTTMDVYERMITKQPKIQFLKPTTTTSDLDNDLLLITTNQMEDHEMMLNDDDIVIGQSELTVNGNVGIIILSVVIGLCMIVGVGLWLYKHYDWLDRMRRRGLNYSNRGDSQSDVLFIPQDETLDMALDY